MAVLSDADRAMTWAVAMQRIFTGFGGITKAELRAAINAIDSWADNNAGSFNTAIPQPARGALSLDEKSQLLAYVVLKRAGLL